MRLRLQPHHLTPSAPLRLGLHTQLTNSGSHCVGHAISLRPVVLRNNGEMRPYPLEPHLDALVLKLWNLGANVLYQFDVAAVSCGHVGTLDVRDGEFTVGDDYDRVDPVSEAHCEFQRRVNGEHLRLEGQLILCAEALSGGGRYAEPSAVDPGAAGRAAEESAVVETELCAAVDEELTGSAGLLLLLLLLQRHLGGRRRGEKGMLLPRYCFCHCRKRREVRRGGEENERNCFCFREVVDAAGKEIVALAFAVFGGRDFEGEERSRGQIASASEGILMLLPRTVISSSEPEHKREKPERR
ncbi:uncharacterized protein MYCGRDRAFT_94815 [Zymoseptoria tritici IPO323]|uniref:Uncharacterized protein n=1 Tax=Zymoseptoria tritici (strain CBS 115943 / IPO323) TaxID=336722 RepID=F9XF88_ZYMTI|nr:uncharacterized protein MYCGRDRAFT_94815 [Zymoseptoria tritici IPO323]EGP85889.1 hypothetical protein MYCGRDRAFT_94815 [Zymoseptoria tritici IPO323]